MTRNLKARGSNPPAAALILQKSSSSFSKGRAIHCNLKHATPYELPMESSITIFFLRQFACELLPTGLCVGYTFVPWLELQSGLLPLHIVHG